MKRAFLAVCASYGLGTVILRAYPDAWAWAQMLVYLAVLPWMWRWLATPPVPPMAEISQDSWCKVMRRDVTPWIRCNQAPGHAGPHAFIIEVGDA